MSMNKIICPRCHTENSMNNNFCRLCGSPLSHPDPHENIDLSADDSSVERCPKCGAPIEDDYDFCMKCGTKLNSCRSGKKRVRILIACVFALAVTVGGGYFIYHSFFENNRGYSQPDLSEPAKSDYVTVQTVEVYEGPGDQEPLESIDENKRIEISKVNTFNSKKEIWGQSENGWILISRDDEEYLEPVKLEDDQSYKTDQEYVILEDSAVYANPALMNSENGEIEQGKKVRLEKIATDQSNTVWGQIENEKWVILKEEDEERIATLASNKAAENQTVSSVPKAPAVKTSDP